MATPRTLTFTPAPTITREAVTQTTVVGQPGFFHGFNYSPRPYYRFSMDLGPLNRGEAEELSALHAYHQGARTFQWDGGQYGIVDDLYVAQADGVRKEYFLANRNIDVASYTIKTRRFSGASFTDSTWVHAVASLRFATGVIVFGTAPFSGDHIRAFYCCKYRVSFAPDGLQLEQFGPGLYNAHLDLVENPGIVLDPFGVPSVYQVALNATARTNPRITEKVPIQRMALRAQRFVTVTVSAATTASSIGSFTRTLSAQAKFTSVVSPLFISGFKTFGTNVVNSGDTFTTVTLNSNSEFVTGAAYWNTTYRVMSHSATLETIGFGTAAGSGGSRFDWSIVAS